MNVNKCFFNIPFKTHTLIEPVYFYILSVGPKLTLELDTTLQDRSRAYTTGPDFRLTYSS